jgi:hypothetical protein
MLSPDESMEMQRFMSNSGMRELAAAVRDTVIVAAFQMILRATLIMRRWNY